MIRSGAARCGNDGATGSSASSPGSAARRVEARHRAIDTFDAIDAGSGGPAAGARPRAAGPGRRRRAPRPPTRRARAVAGCLRRALRRRRGPLGRDPLRRHLERRHHRRARRRDRPGRGPARARLGHGRGCRPAVLVRGGLRRRAGGPGCRHRLVRARHSTGLGVQPGAPAGPIPPGAPRDVAPRQRRRLLWRSRRRQERPRLLRQGRAPSRGGRARTRGGLPRRHPAQRRGRNAARLDGRPLHQGQGLAARGRRRTGTRSDSGPAPS